MRETTRNLTTALPRSLMVGLAIAGLIGALTWSELQTSSRILVFQREFVAAGGNVFVATGVDGISAHQCEALANTDIVLAAGGVRLVDAEEVNTAPGTLFQVVEATSGVLQIWSGPDARAPALRSMGLVVGVAAADELGLGPGSFLGIGDERPSEVAAVYDPGRRYPNAERWIVVPTAPVGLVDECWVEFAAGSRETGGAALGFLLGGSSVEVDISPLADLDQFSFNPKFELLNRPQGNAWAIAGFALTVLLALIAWLRRRELGLYRALGTSQAALWLMAQLEAVLLVGSASAIGFLFALALNASVQGSLPDSDQLVIAARTNLSTALVVITLAPIATLLIGRGRDLLSQLKSG